MSVTAWGILLLGSGAVLKYGDYLAAGASWLWSKLPAVSLPSLPVIGKKSTVPTAAQAFAALTLIQDFKARAIDDPSYKLITAALNEVTK